MLRCISSLLYRQTQRLAALPILARSFSSAPDADGFVYGTVQNYRRSKAFGFIAPQDGSGKYYIHRTSIVGAPPNGRHFPYLKKNDKVRFTLAPSVKDPAVLQAVNVTYANGAHVPHIRKDYLENNRAKAHERLGRAVHSIMFNHVSDDESKMTAIRAAYGKMTDSIAAARERAAAQGLQVEAESAAENTPTGEELK